MQPEIVALAEGAIFEAWRADVRMLVALADEDGGHDPAHDLATNKLSMTETIDGILHLSGQLVGEHALSVKHAADAKPTTCSAGSPPTTSSAPTSRCPTGRRYGRWR
jgi:hypothetical protein